MRTPCGPNARLDVNGINTGRAEENREQRRSDAKATIRKVLYGRIRFQYEPTGSKDGVAGSERHAADQGQWFEDIQNAPAETRSVDSDALHDGSHDETLHQCSD